MFVDAIERVDSFTRPLHSIVRLYGHDGIIPGTATLFFVNEEACAITCKHVADLVAQADAIFQNYREFQGARRDVLREKNANHLISQLETKYKLSPDTIIRIRNNFIGCVDQFQRLNIDRHPTQDLAILRFEGYKRVLYNSYATFLRDTSRIKPGRSLCRLGYPFPEFTNFRYNPSIDDIEWDTTGRILSPSFPIDGIVTRLTTDNRGVLGIEMSTPGLRGQSGGPLFDTNGLIFGMQSSTTHLHLGFDIEDHEVLVNGRKRRVSNYPFLNVGRCVHVDVIKAFLREKGVNYYEG
ncbi:MULTISPECIES: trypsin-like peptidase domain-containing protein [unclassified Spirosoma]|uniref:trypsin-like peptidase domain-containing protein n=1 Tax=unclassified Spirosoma TaxID=2621999 RepID=UPI000966C980|nr:MULTISPECIES: trypsin-like peptidase domain-containing protein [unclassified Spirosoma]MBN8821751.1 trypsin-like peptidase domain-containing protein [Spirosoma sp.]OJW80756.1 MAG: serine protease [Spirosoma sp. 48-14]